MIDFNRKPSQKSENETLFDKLNEEYQNKFGEPYVTCFGKNVMSWENMIADIRKCIETGKPQYITPYKEGVTY